MLSPHDPMWAREFAELRNIYRSALGDLVLRVEHVGSTAVPDLLAKAIPDIDIDIVMPSYALFPQIVAALRSLGYEHRGDQGICQREVFRPKAATAPIVPQRKTFMAHHLYVCPASSPELQRHIGFRDMLRARPDLRRAYEAMKIGIAQRSGGDRRVYADIKERECRAFVDEVLGQVEQGPADRT